MAKKTEDSIIKAVLQGSNLPILTIDERWNELFPEHEKNSEIRRLEKIINKLLKEQGKLVNDLKEMKKLKSTLMENIVNNIDNGEEESSKKKIRQQERDQKMILELKEKIERSEERLMDIPHQIKQANNDLLVAGVKDCYERLTFNKKKIMESEQWVVQIREELKNRILEKQDMKMRNDLIYSTMHAIVGPKIMEVFDKDNKKKEEGDGKG